MGAFLQYVAGFTAGVLAAAVLVIIMGFVLPRPAGPPDQLAGHFMGLMYCVFPIMAMIFGLAGVFTVARSRS